MDQDQLNQDEKTVLSMVNDKQKQIAQEWEWPQLQDESPDDFQLIEGQDTYNLEAKGNKTIDPTRITYLAVKVTQWEELYQITDQDFLELDDNDIEEPGDPDYFRIIGWSAFEEPTVEIYPEPDQDYEARYEYYGLPNRLERSDDITLIDEQALIWGTVEAVLAFDGEDFSRARSEFQQAIRRARQNSRSNKDIQIGRQAVNNNLGQPTIDDYNLGPNN